MDYPRFAHVAQVQGKVELQARISSEGGVISISSKSGHPLRVPAARGNRSHGGDLRPGSGDESIGTVVVGFAFVIEGSVGMSVRRSSSSTVQLT